VGECFFWYRPTRAVPDQRPLNGRCCCCISGIIGELSSFIWMQSLCVAGFTEYLLLKFIIVPMIEVTCTVEVAPCARPHIIIAVDYVLQLRDMLGHPTSEHCHTGQDY